MPYKFRSLIDETDLATARRELGPALARILGYFRKDGVASITRIEDAMAHRDAAAMVVPAHTLKGEARQFGAERLAELAAHLELTARDQVERRQELPAGLLDDVDALRPLFHETLLALADLGVVDAPAARQPIAPHMPAPAKRRTAFGRRPG